MSEKNISVKKNIVLIGFMGSGKTVIGRQVARILNYEFIDTDAEIREVTGMDLTRLFHKHGEIRFRSEERLIITKLARRDGLVIACGSSLPPNQENLCLLHENSWIVMLTAAPEVLNTRLSRKHDRLLIGGKLTPQEIATEAARWTDEYRGLIDCTIDSGAQEVDLAAETIVTAFRANILSAI